MISIVAAMGHCNVIGNGNRMPWRLPADLAYFKKLTLDHPILMGRKTFDSIGKPLPGRKNIIITRDPDFQIEGCTIIHSIAEAVKLCSDIEVFIIGGAQIYQELLSYSDRLYITTIEADFEGDSFFPTIDNDIWQIVSKVKGETNEQNPYEYYFLIYEKRC